MKKWADQPKINHAASCARHKFIKVMCPNQNSERDDSLAHRVDSKNS